MKGTTSSEVARAGQAEEVERLRQENAQYRETLEDLLVILGDPEGYCADDRREVAEAVQEVRRALQQAASLHR